MTDFIEFDSYQDVYDAREVVGYFRPTLWERFRIWLSSMILGKKIWQKSLPGLKELMKRH